jgi:FAD/FMN-containing dehydrogenase/Fe-S oxidoreductase
VDTALQDCVRELGEKLEGQVRVDPVARILYSTDASIYQIEPLGVVFPRGQEDLLAAVKIASTYGIPILARGAGSSLAGQAIGPALILDCSRYLNRILDINPDNRTALVEPGVVLSSLNRRLARCGLQFGPDPASAERATLGGSIANNATGAHSILYGMAADHLISAEVVLADGSPAVFSTVVLDEARRRAGLDLESRGDGRAYPTGSKIEAGLYRAALQIREEFGGAIRERWPRTWRRASGYNLNYLLPWSPAKPPFWSPEWHAGRPGVGRPGDYPPAAVDSLNLAQLLAGSEGTLAVFRTLTLNLVPKPEHTLLVVLPYPSIAAACRAVPGLLAEVGPSAVELIPMSLIDLARSVPAYCEMAAFVDVFREAGVPEALLAVELAGSDPAALCLRAERLGQGAEQRAYLAATPAEQSQVWGVRKVGLGLLLSRKGDEKPAAFIEDLSVPVDRLGEFVAEMERLFEKHGASWEIYAHASAGCLHIRPLLDLKSGEGVRRLRQLAGEAVEITLGLEGAVSGEHGDGLARSEWLERMYGTDVLSAFRLIKNTADPQNLLNPGKILDAPRMDTHLRYGEGYRSGGWETRLDFSTQGGLSGAVEQCNGAGVCRKSEGVMCPSFQATQDEMHSTRGRANLLRLMLSGGFPPGCDDEQAVYQALELCLACKGCKAECPSGVDMAKLKYEFLAEYYSDRRRPARDYLFGFIHRLAWLGSPWAPLLNPLLNSGAGGRTFKRALGLAVERPFPPFALRTLFELVKKGGIRPKNPAAREGVFLLADAFTVYFYPEQGLAALKVLERLGIGVKLLQTMGAGRTLISKGFLEAGRKHAADLVDEIYRLDPGGSLPVIGIEPSEIYTLRDEYPDLLPEDPRVKDLAGRALMIDEFLVRPGVDGRPRLSQLHPQVEAAPSGPGLAGAQVYLHGHCYQKAQPPAADGGPVGVAATTAMLEAVGYQVKVIDSGCCGMAGAFGYEADHYEVSMKVGEKLLQTVNAAPPEAAIAASGVSCKAQIEDGSLRKVKHPVQLVEMVLGEGSEAGSEAGSAARSGFSG